MAESIHQSSGMESEGKSHEQDNQAAKCQEKNEKASSTKQTKHIEIQYFFVTDLIKYRLVTVVHCPTQQMIADYFTNPLQKQLFQVHHNTILGITMSDYVKYQQANAKVKATYAENL